MKRTYRSTDGTVVAAGCILILVVVVGIDLLIAWGVQTVANEGFGQDWSYGLALLFTVVVTALTSGLRHRS